MKLDRLGEDADVYEVCRCASSFESTCRLEVEHVLKTIEAGKCLPQLVQRSRSKRTDCQETRWLEHPACFRHCRRGVAPLKGQVGPIKVGAGIGKGQMLDVGADATAGDAQHRLGEIDGQDRAGRPALLERPAAVAGSGAGIDDMRRRLCRQGGKQQIGYPAL